MNDTDISIASLTAAAILDSASSIPVTASGFTGKITPNRLMVESAATLSGLEDRLYFNYTFPATYTGDAFKNAIRVNVKYTGEVDLEHVGVKPPDPQVGGIRVWLESDSTGIANHMTGTLHGISSQVCCGPGSTEATALFTQVLGKSSSSGLWGIDHHVHGPLPIDPHQASMQIGISTLMGNYRPDPIFGNSIGYSAQARPYVRGLWGGTDIDKGDYRTYPNDAGFLCNGRSGFATQTPATEEMDVQDVWTTERSFHYGFVVGGILLGPWNTDNTPSRIGIAFAAQDYDDIGLYLGHPFAETTAYAIITESDSGCSGFGVPNPTARIEVNGALRLNPTTTTKPIASASSRGSLWVNMNGVGTADTMDICLKNSSGGYSWKQIMVG